MTSFILLGEGRSFPHSITGLNTLVTYFNLYFLFLPKDFILKKISLKIVNNLSEDKEDVYEKIIFKYDNNLYEPNNYQPRDQIVTFDFSPGIVLNGLEQIHFDFIFKNSDGTHRHCDYNFYYSAILQETLENPNEEDDSNDDPFSSEKLVLDKGLLDLRNSMNSSRIPL